MLLDKIEAQDLCSKEEHQTNQNVRYDIINIIQK